jgi:hypothetical protein
VEDVDMDVDMDVDVDVDVEVEVDEARVEGIGTEELVIMFDSLSKKCRALAWFMALCST